MIEFKQFVDLTNINDSMELDSGKIIARMNRGNTWASLEVRGGVKVRFYEKTYTSPFEFPKDLKELIHERRDWYHDENVYLTDRNWFEIFRWEGEHGVPEADVTDAENLTPVEVFNMLYGAIMSW